MGDAIRSSEAPKAGTELPDLAEWPLKAVFDAEDSALANCLRRLLTDMSGSSEHYSAHGSTP